MSSVVPHLTTALNGPLLQLESHLLARQTDVEAWLREQWLQTPAPFYASVDLRNAGFKLAPVDTNLFPAGFNNLNPAFMPLCIQAAQAAVERVCPRARRILIIAENHTRNLFYLESLETLRGIFEQAGLDARIASLRDDITDAMEVTLLSGKTCHLAPLERKGNRVAIGDFSPCLVLLNNDLSAGKPAILEDIEQELVPPLKAGWSTRKKSDHFTHYTDVANAFAEKLDIDPWLVSPMTLQCGEVDFMARSGTECLARNVETMLNAVQKKYDQYGIDRQPFAVVKADSGTYGMGIMTVKSVEEITNLNRKQRNKMASAKEGLVVDNVLIQEGVYTFETLGEDQAVAEPVIYMMDHFVVGGFYRVHTGRTFDENLNAPGMHFEPLAFAQSCIEPNKADKPDAEPNRFYAYGVIARLALLAAARELA
ncbi:Glutamate--cysteine ligase, divergent, of Alpha- and Beta-proteobacteria type [Methylophaga frappieri]|uniref:Glutamate--cysteine ligase, divergent, of Alpha-and Beta-proteobacteria type n=1 Tax=Methylophaga frappieri (strain ATCC BAA-2434 / DSM 25690 / JAM7) TaxID=754477 RepID=I1YJ11_METFJ|nr:glutamate--cysteine ligase [Methylophaga frappieri]AFJ02904.1 Glutamate--cysteine ligase, divergent, of Alpha- and Beta-proteobacteria type [Methylophaga frappieri]